MTDKKPDTPSRRRQPSDQNPIFKLLIGCSLAGWVMLVAAMVLFHYARPELMTGAMSYWDVDVRGEWDASLVGLLLLTLLVTLGLAGTGTYFRRKRTRRKRDAVWFNLPVLLVISVVLTLYVLTQLMA